MTYCPPNCKACKIEFNPWLPHNEKIVDFIRWNELKIHGIILLIFYLLLGLGWAIIIWLVLLKIMDITNTPLWDVDEYPPPKIKYKECGLGHKDCIYKAKSY